MAATSHPRPARPVKPPEHTGRRSGPDRHTADPGDPVDRGAEWTDGRGTLPMARWLTDPAIEAEIQALAASAPAPTEDRRAALARMLRLDHRPASRRTPPLAG